MDSIRRSTRTRVSTADVSRPLAVRAFASDNDHFLDYVSRGDSETIAYSGLSSPQKLLKKHGFFMESMIKGNEMTSFNEPDDLKRMAIVAMEGEGNEQEEQYCFVNKD